MRTTRREITPRVRASLAPRARRVVDDAPRIPTLTFRAFSQASRARPVSPPSRRAFAPRARATLDAVFASRLRVAERARIVATRAARVALCLAPTENARHTMPRPRVAVVALEYDRDAFSGNGILCQGLARSLAAHADVLVLCARPRGSGREDDVPVVTRGDGATTTAYVDVDTWHRLDRLGPHEQFARGCASRAIRDAVAAFGASACLGVDFSAVAAATNSGLCGGDVPFIWSPFRIFSRSDFDGHHALECDGVRRSDGVLALCASDADFVTERLGAAVRPLVVHPPLRESVLKIARARRGETRRRKYLTCVVRVSEEKEPHRFVELCEELARRGVFDSKALSPVFCANASLCQTSAYAQDLKARFQKCAPSGRVIEHFLSPEELGELFSETILNIHPPTHDAFGMTIVESAAFGAPSVVHHAGAVGASDLLQTIGVDVEAPTREFADKIEEILLDARTRVVAENAHSKALEWDEASFGHAVFDFLFSHIRNP